MKKKHFKILKEDLKELFLVLGAVTLAVLVIYFIAWYFIQLVYIGSPTEITGSIKTPQNFPLFLFFNSLIIAFILYRLTRSYIQSVQRRAE